MFSLSEVVFGIISVASEYLDPTLSCSLYIDLTLGEDYCFKIWLYSVPLIVVYL